LQTGGRKRRLGDARDAKANDVTPCTTTVGTHGDAGDAENLTIPAALLSSWLPTSSILKLSFVGLKMVMLRPIVPTVPKAGKTRHFCKPRLRPHIVPRGCFGVPKPDRRDTFLEPIRTLGDPWLKYNCIPPWRNQMRLTLAESLKLVLSTTAAPVP